MRARHLLVTNDFPPKVGGIQAYLWELWRRLDAERFVVLTAASHPDHAAFDAELATTGFRVERVPRSILYFPTPANVRRVRDVAARAGASLVIIDPALPLGLMGPHLGIPYGVVLHGAEVSAPGRLPVSRQALAHVLRHASVVVAAGDFVATEAARAAGSLANVVVVPPGVDRQRFAPLGEDARRAARARLGLPEDGLLVTSVSRLVPRKGMDVLVEAAQRLRGSFPDLVVAIAGSGRDQGRLGRMVARLEAPVRMLGWISEDDKAELLGCGDVFAMACRSRWGTLEQEGFGIVFLEAAASGSPQIAGKSGGATEAVQDGETGIVVQRPRDPAAIAAALRRLLSDHRLRQRMGTAARARSASFDYDLLARRLAVALDEVGG
jgi:phosphatidylinositol alpha-1,6-mannosyltransferase